MGLANVMGFFFFVGVVFFFLSNWYVEYGGAQSHDSKEPKIKSHMVYRLSQPGAPNLTGFVTSSQLPSEIKNSQTVYK